MNRFDEIRAQALATASLLTSERETRDKVADGLIRLVGLMVKAVGKGVAIDGETDREEAYRDSEEVEFVQGHTRYLLGESIQSRSSQVTEAVLEADLGRYDKPVWTDPLASGGLGFGAECWDE